MLFYLIVLSLSVGWKRIKMCGTFENMLFRTMKVGSLGMNCDGMLFHFTYPAWTFIELVNMRHFWYPFKTYFLENHIYFENSAHSQIKVFISYIFPCRDIRVYICTYLWSFKREKKTCFGNPAEKYLPLPSICIGEHIKDDEAQHRLSATYTVA